MTGVSNELRTPPSPWLHLGNRQGPALLLPLFSVPPCLRGGISPIEFHRRLRRTSLEIREVHWRSKSVGAIIIVVAGFELLTASSWTAMPALRHSTGLAPLDELLGGGLLPGTMTVVLGATGIGKTQLGIHYADAGRRQEGERGVFFDMTSRGDSQSHADYAKRMSGWDITEQSPEIPLLFEEIWDRSKARRDSLHVFRQTGKRVTMSDLDDDQKIEWKAELNRKLEQTIAFFYGNFVQGVRRCVIDGMEPSDRASDSFQFERFEYIYQQILRKESAWVARIYFGLSTGPTPRPSRSTLTSTPRLGACCCVRRTKRCSKR